MIRILNWLKWMGLALVGIQSGWAQTPARQAGYLYLSPEPNASYVSQQTRFVLVRFTNLSPGQVTNLASGFITVTGVSSEAHSGVVHVASDSRTIIYQMTADFAANESVTVSLNPAVATGAAGSAQPFQYQFIVTAPMPGSLPLTVAPALAQPPADPGPPLNVARPAITGSSPAGKPRPKAMVMGNGVSVPSTFPHVVIGANKNPSPGYLFLENALDGVSPYTMMLDNDGQPVWYRTGRMYDFKIQKNGMITWALSDDTGFPAFDQNFNYLKTYLTTNGYSTDSHDLKVLADGTYFMIGYRNNTVDMSKYIQGGLPGTLVRETVVQEFTAADELIFQWRAWDNYKLQDLGGNSDFPHMNGVDIDEDGNLLISARHLSEVTKVNLASGDIIWHLSGPHSSFSFPNDLGKGTSFQHNITALGHGHYTVFDNGNTRIPAYSRAVEYQLDLTNMLANMVWQFRDVPDKYTYWLGSAQRLPSGNTLIDFVLPQYPKVIEVDTNGVKRFELSLAPSSDSYRAFRLPWTGVVAAPYLIVEPEVDNITLVFNKFGDTNVAYYRIYGGTSPHPATILTESYTTLAQLSNLAKGTNYFRVTAVSPDGTESPFSNEENVDVNITAPGQNMVVNGDFSQQGASWDFIRNDTGSAGWVINNGVSEFAISNGGAGQSSIQLLQPGKALIQGKQYVLEFDAWATAPRYIQVQLSQSLSPFTDYSLITPPFLIPNPAHFRYVFKMQNVSDFSANLIFNMGGSSSTVYLQNISLFNPIPGDLNLDGHVDYLDLSSFANGWLKQGINLPGDLNNSGTVDFNDFQVFGANWPPGIP
jgi:hypothetical protein